MSKELIPGPLFSDNIKVLSIILLFLFGAASFLYVKVESYGGDWSCLFVRCVKLIP